MTDYIVVPKQATELEAALSDQDYWNKVGELIGLRARGWTGRHVADLRGDERWESMECPAWLAERLLTLTLHAPAQAEIDRLRAEVASYHDAHLQAEARALAAEAQVERMRVALRDLVAECERHDAAVAMVIGRPVGWRDQYLDAARAELQEPNQ